MPVRRIRPIVTMLVVAVVVAGAQLQGAGRAGALVLDPGPFLSLSPTSGLPGDPVTAAGSDPAVNAATSCSLLWDDPAISLPCGLDDTGRLSSDFTVPQDALPGSHAVTLTSSSGSTAASFDVLTVVPEARAHSVRDALVLMKQAGLRMVGGGADLDQLIATEVPEAGTPVTRGSLVTVTLQAVVVTAPPPTSSAATSAPASDAADPGTPTGALAGVTPTAGTVATATATATARTEPATTPTVSASPAATTRSTGGGFPPLVIAAVAALFVFVAAGGATRHVRRRRLRPRVHLRPRPDGAALPTTTGAPARVPALRLEPHSDDLAPVEVRQ